MDLRKRIRDGRQSLLVRLARRGNEDAFKRLYRELYAPVAGYIRSRVQNAEDAEDLCSNVFKNFLLRLGDFDNSRGSVMTWVVAMARNAVIDHYRRTHRAAAGAGAARHGDGDLAAMAPDPRPNALQVMIGDEEIDRVRRILARQPFETREMFALRFEQGLRVREVAEVMGMSPDAAKQRFARAFRKLQQELTEEEKPRGGEKPCAATD